MKKIIKTLGLSSVLSISACSVLETANQASEESFYGTLSPMASNAVYFLMTDRFVNGDPTNDYIDQGGEFPTYRNELKGPDGKSAFVGYMGGDFKGILDNADYIADMGFGAIWLTPIVDQPDQAFSGGEKIEFGGAFKDGGKTGYHGYWGSNFFKVDEHLPSEDLTFADLTEKLREEHNLKTVLDIVLNHGSPAFTMPKQQPKFGQVFDEDDELIADHQNLSPEQLDKSNPLHAFFNTKKDIMQLSDFDENSPAMDYLTEAYLHWIDQGADAFRIDTIKHMPHTAWKTFTDNIREDHPDFFMFAESYSFDANFIAEHTKPENGGVSVLDFPGREAMLKVFENANSDFELLNSYLYLEDSPYQNSYELMTFYDNHDMSRMDASEAGFIDAHNWLFTSRGIPVVYYGSEVGFMAGTSEHQGNRNYFGQGNVYKAVTHPIFENLKRVANIRKKLVALQKGLQVNVKLKGNEATFYRVYEHEGVYQTALILLNKSGKDAEMKVDKWLSSGEWSEQISGEKLRVNTTDTLKTVVPAHGLKIYVLNEKNNNEALALLLSSRM